MQRTYSNRIVFVMIGLSIVSVLFAVRQFTSLKNQIYAETLAEAMIKN